MISKVLLYGDLAEKFGKELEIHGSNCAKVLQILEANFPGKFYSRLKTGEFFVWQDDERGIETPEDVVMGTGKPELHIMPAVAGAGGRGGLLAILGTVLLGAAVVFSGALAAPTLGAGVSALFSGGTVWSTVATIGLGLTLSGVSQLVAPMPDTSRTDSNERSEDRPSYLYTGPVQNVNEGGAIPLVYGRPFVGGIIVSGGVAVEQL